MNTSQFEPKRFGKYLLLEKVAQGGMAQLFRAKITGVQGFEKFIAIKWILPHLATEKELVDSFIDEAKLAALLNHQNIVQIYGFGHIKDNYFISMEYLFGKDVRRIFEKSKENGLFISTEHSLHLTSRICSALDYAHNMKDYQGNLLHIIHRDVSPQNIFVTYEGEVKILDFGIAKAATQSTLTQVGMIKGKVAYMSPEQAAGKIIDHRSDIFSTGILLYEMLTNKRMFIGDTLQVLAQIREARIPWPGTIESDLPQQILDILRRALTKEPEERYQSCGEMQADIEKCMIELSMRPTTRGLAQYMKEIFKEEIAAESQVIREAAAISVGEELEPAQGEQPPEQSQKEALKIAEAEVQKERIKKMRLYAALAVLLVSGLVFILWPTQKPDKETPEKTAQVDDSGTKKTDQVVASVTEETDQVVASGTEKTDQVVASGTEKTAQVDGSETGSTKIAEEESGLIEETKRLQNEVERLLETDPQEAITLLIEWIALDPESALAYSQLGLVYVKLEDYPKAIEAYQKAVELDPESAPAFSQLGLIYVKLEDYHKALESYEAAAALDPQLPDTYFNLGFVYARTKDYARAEEMYGEAVELSPPYLDDALFNLAMVQKKQGKLKLSIENLRRTLSVNPDHRLALRYLEELEAKYLNNSENS